VICCDSELDLRGIEVADRKITTSDRLADGDVEVIHTRASPAESQAGVADCYRLRK